MALPFTDTFTNSDGTALSTHDAGWDVTLNAWEINSNRADTSSGTGGEASLARWTTDTPTDDQLSNVTLNVDGTGAIEVGGCVRMSADGDGYGYTTAQNGDSYLERYDNGAVTNLANPAIGARSNGDEIGADAQGTSIRGLLDDVAQTTQTDSTYSSGQGGLAAWGNGGDPAADSVTIESLGVVNTTIEVPSGPWR